MKRLWKCFVGRDVQRLAIESILVYVSPVVFMRCSLFHSIHYSSRLHCTRPISLHRTSIRTRPNVIRMTSIRDDLLLLVRVRSTLVHPDLHGDLHDQ